MRRPFEDVRPDVVQQMHQSVFATQTLHSCRKTPPGRRKFSSRIGASRRRVRALREHDFVCEVMPNDVQTTRALLETKVVAWSQGRLETRWPSPLDSRHLRRDLLRTSCGRALCLRLREPVQLDVKRSASGQCPKVTMRQSCQRQTT